MYGGGGMHMEYLTGKGKMAGVLLRALIFSYLMTTAALLILAFAMLKLQPDGRTAELAILAVYVLSCFAGGWYAGRKAGRRKFLQGLLVGILYFVLLFLISGLGDRAVQSDLVQGALAFVLCAFGGMLGGMVS